MCLDYFLLIFILLSALKFYMFDRDAHRKLCRYSYSLNFFRILRLPFRSNIQQSSVSTNASFGKKVTYDFDSSRCLYWMSNFNQFLVERSYFQKENFKFFHISTFKPFDPMKISNRKLALRCFQGLLKRKTFLIDLLKWFVGNILHQALYSAQDLVATTDW